MDYPVEVLGEEDDNGTMPQNVAELAQAIVGHRIAKVEKGVEMPGEPIWRSGTATVITLDSGKRVALADNSDCCAYTELDAFLLHPELVDHVITGIGTTGGYTDLAYLRRYGRCAGADGQLVAGQSVLLRLWVQHQRDRC